MPGLQHTAARAEQFANVASTSLDQWIAGKARESGVRRGAGLTGAVITSEQTHSRNLPTSFTSRSDRQAGGDRGCDAQRGSARLRRAANLLVRFASRQPRVTRQGRARGLERRNQLGPRSHETTALRLQTFKAGYGIWAWSIRIGLLPPRRSSPAQQFDTTNLTTCRAWTS